MRFTPKAKERMNFPAIAFDAGKVTSAWDVTNAEFQVKLKGENFRIYNYLYKFLELKEII